MKLHLLDRKAQDNISFNVSYNSYPHFLKVWHYHPELELVVIVKSTGTHFIGDNIERFEPGDLVLIGKDLPHMWLSDESYFKTKKKDAAVAISIHFKRDFLGENFLLAPENRAILRLLDRSVRGMKFVGVDNGLVTAIKQLHHLKSFKKLMTFLEILNELASHEEVRMLSSPSFLDNFLKTDNKRLDKIYEFVYNHFKDNINSKEVATFIGMNASAFSRYFKKVHRKTFTTYLNEIRVGYACKRLLEGDTNITAIGFESGFRNLSNFNRQFKTITELSPSQYIKMHT